MVDWLFIVFCLLSDKVAADAAEDWLVAKIITPSRVVEKCWPEYDNVCGLEIGNELITRRFAMTPTFGTIDYLRNATVCAEIIENK